ncbi:uncharacterized protein LOC133852671 [Alnus glutinosa]|uniref:uncharacterized protein LOC133852671 n=1 Tax=Alnus glutinosa TaxID=3517 RepID=UPI002D7A0CA8|nr:uncharacterized protein LOC133852671 [Alnus glutinosa]
MASIVAYSLLPLAAMFFFFFFFHPIQSNEQTQQTIESICHQVGDYDLCKQALNSNLKNPDANISDLNELTINLTIRNATDTRAFTQSVLKNSTSYPEAVKVLSECENDYGLVVETFQVAFEFYNQRDYSRMLYLESLAPNAISSCEAGLNSAAPGPVNPYFYLIERNKPLKTLVDMAMVIAHTFADV